MSIMKRLINLGYLLMIASLLSCDQELSGARYDSTDELQIMDYIDDRDDLSIFREMVDYVGQRSLLKTAGTYTVFIPTNEAFGRLFDRLSTDGESIDALSDREPDFWLNYFRYHLLDQKVNTNEFIPGPLPAASSLNGKFIIADIRDSYTSIRLNNFSTITEYNIELSNGYIDIVDEVLAPPVNSIYDALESTGKYSIMLDIFEETGLTHYLRDSLLTLLVESDETLRENNFNPETIENLGDWAAYHIIPDSGYYLNQLARTRFYPLFREESLQFSEDGFGQYYLNGKYRFDQSPEYGIDRVQSNGVYHSMDTVIHIEEAPPSTIRFNIYPPGSDHGEQNVFTEAPAAIKLNTGTRSYHQNREFKIAQFDAQQVGDYFYLTVPDVAAGKYRLRLIHRPGGTRGEYLTVYNDEIIKDDIALHEPDGDFEEWDYYVYNYCGDITVESRSDVTIYFAFRNFGSNNSPGYCCDALMDMLELIPITE